MRQAAHPGLYDVEGDVPSLLGTRCNGCGTTFFPALGIGCEVCGAGDSSLQPITLSATGVLHSIATVHLHQGHDIEAPFAIAEIQLDDGPLIRATMREPLGLESIGQRVGAGWFTLRADEEGHEVVEPRFDVAR
jgi:uncharacterized OB-fold protein